MSAQELIIDSFAGGGGASTGIEMALGRSPDYAINHDPIALALHQANHPETVHLSKNVWHVDPLDVVGRRPVGLAWFSPDCFPAGTMILTERGYRPIEAIVEGDRVLTHAGRYRRVYATMQAVKAVRHIDVQGVPTITVSDEHPFYARAMHNVWDNANRRYQRTLAPADWVLAKDLRTGSAPMNAVGGDRHFCATPCSFDHIAIPEVGGRGIVLDERLMWLAGRYVGDGWSRLGDGRAELVITCGKLEADDLAERLALWPRSGERAMSSELAWHRRDTKTAHQFSTSHRGLVEWLRDQFGHGGAEKSFPAWALSAPDPMRRALLAGYVSADGSEFPTGSNRVTETVTISKALALSTKALAESLGFTATISQPRSNTAMIDGRMVNAKPTYMVRWREVPVRSQTVRDDLHNWSRVQSVGGAGEDLEVYNISVEEDETYVADGIVVHNCKHFSKAKGGAPVKRNIRDLAWVVVLWAKRARPRVIILENVEEFRTWGPLTEDGRPCPVRKGKTFEAWVRELRRLGYRVEHKELRACDYGAPTIRKRLFVIARRDSQAIDWPKPTHGDPKSAGVRSGKLLPWRTAAEIIDWHLPCPSIFDTSAQIWEKFGLRAKRPLAEATHRRIVRGTFRYVIDNPRPFIVSVAHGDSGGRREWPLDRPLNTMTQSREHAVVAPIISYAQQGGGNRSIEEPLHTITASVKDQNTVVAPLLIPRYGERPGQEPRCLSIEEPHPVVVPDGNGASLVSAFLAQHNDGPRNAGISGRSAEEPVSTISSEGALQQVVAAHLTKFHSGSTGSGLDEPAPTMTANSFHKRPGGAAPIGLVAAHMVTLRRNADGQAMDEPARTVTSGGGHQGAVYAFLQKYYGSDQDPRIEEPMHTDTTKPRFGLVTVHVEGEPYALVDIGMRMLTPRERFRAQGFPDAYEIEHGLLPDGSQIRLTLEQQGRACGNSVCPPLAAALVAANCADLAAGASRFAAE